MTAFCAACKSAPEDALSIHQSALEAEAAPQEATIDTLSVGILEDAGRRHPLFPQSAQMVSLTALVFEGLFETDDAGRAGFCLAEDYQTAQNEDGSFTWTIKIRPNVAWHDGSGCVTAQDAAFTIGTIASAGGFYASNVQGIASAAAQDEQTLVIVTDRYYADLPERLTFPIVPQHVYQGKNGEDPVMVGSGAYRLSAQDADGYLFQLSAFEGWWHEQPSIKTIYVTTYHDAVRADGGVFAQGDPGRDRLRRDDGRGTGSRNRHGLYASPPLDGGRLSEFERHFFRRSRAPGGRLCDQ